MSDVSSGQSSHAIYGGIIVDVAEESLDRASKLLAGVNGGVYKAVGSALSRAAAAGRTHAKKPITEEYSISQSQFLASTKNINHFQKSNGGSISVVFGFRGNVIPLLKFNTSVDGGGRVVTQVKRSGARAALDKAFRASMGSHTGIYERVGDARLPVRELFGPSTPQMMYSNEEVLDSIEEKMADTYEQRIEHEIDALLNGWRR